MVKTVQALIKISEHSNRVLNIVKAKYGLRDKSQAIDLMAEHYCDELMEVKPSYIRKLKRIMKRKPIYVGTVENLRRMTTNARHRDRAKAKGKAP